MTPLAIRDDGLQWFGCDQAASAPTFLLTNIATELTGTLEEIFTLGPTWLRQKDVDLRVIGPRTLTGKTIAQYGTQFTADTGTAVDSTMLGCLAEIQGDQRWVTIKTADSLGVGATLRGPFMGPDVTAGQVIVYGDAIKLTSQFGAMSPVYLHPAQYGRYQRQELQPLNDRKQLQEKVFHWRHNTVDMPLFYMMEHDDGSLFLRLFPWPNADYNLHFQGEVIPSKYTVDDLSDDANDVPIPGDMSASVLLPIFRYRLTKYPHFNNDEARPNLQEDYERAKAILRAMDPQVAKELRIKPGFC